MAWAAPQFRAHIPQRPIIRDRNQEILEDFGRTAGRIPWLPTAAFRPVRGVPLGTLGSEPAPPVAGT